MENCVFCKIVDGSVPATKVYEDTLHVAFLDIRPHRLGHVQLIPKTHYRWIWDMPEMGPIYEAARKIAKAQEKGLGADFIVSLTFGEQVPHAHVQLIPAKKGDGAELFTDYPQYAPGQMEAVAAKIRAALG